MATLAEYDLGIKWLSFYRPFETQTGDGEIIPVGQSEINAIPEKSYFPFIDIDNDEDKAKFHRQLLQNRQEFHTMCENPRCMDKSKTL